MELPEVQALLDSYFAKLELKLNDKFTKIYTQFQELDIPDTRNMATKKFVTDLLAELKTSISTELSATNTAVTKIATETETKIKELSTKKSDFMDSFKTLLG